MTISLRVLGGTIFFAVLFVAVQGVFHARVSADAVVLSPERIVLPYLPNPILATAKEITTPAISIPKPEEPVQQKPTHAVHVEEKKIALPKISDKPSQTAAMAKPTSPYGRLLVPSIGLSRDIGAVGLTAEGAMGVLNDPSRVSWFSGGVRPGARGSAVIAAHVFQSFANLHNLNVGDDIYVEQQNGSKLHFVVQKTAVYAYTDVDSFQSMFKRADGAYLNLITCYGDLVGDHSTYTHRLVVYASLQ